jgi:hypothetical protein
MSTAAMQQLDKDLYEYLKDSAGDFRLFYSDKKVHAISLIQSATINQTWEEMARREGYNDIEFFKSALTPAGLQSLDRTINKGCGALHKKLFALMQAEDKKEGSTFSYDIVGTNSFYFTVTITSKTKGGNVFKKFKEFKATAQKQLITQINTWSKKYSNRGVKGHANEKSGKGKTQSNQIRRKEYIKDASGKTKASGSNDPFIDVGHMEGSEVGTLRTLAAKQFLDNWKATTPQAETARNSALDRLKGIAQWVFETDLTFSGELEKNVTATLESSRINKASMSKGEVAGLNAALFRGMSKLKKAGEWVHAEGSDSFFDMVEKTAVAAWAEGLKPNKTTKRLKTKVKYKRRKSSKGAPVKGKERKQKAKIIRGPLYRKAPLKRLKTSIASTKSAASFQPLAMIGLINKELPSVVEGNMGRPRLESQTGTLAASTEVTDIISTPQGFPSIGYTYQTNPYQTFEPGGEQGSNDYDPRTLIDQSLRAIAAKFAMGRFYTRRVM